MTLWKVSLLMGAHEAVSWVGIIVVLGLMAMGGRWALVQAQTERAKVLAGMRLAIGALAAFIVCAGLNGFVYRAGASCSIGPPSIPLPALCKLVRASALLSLGSAVLFLVSVVVWPPWRPPLRLQLVRIVVVLGWWLVFALGFILTGVVFDT